ncbi:MAG: AAA family ATPase [Peptoniphilaceae bacterium]|nr:AAA family ATPase [Peptoniphilaceae bacterium]
MLINTKNYKYKLPTLSGDIEEHSTHDNSVIIIGANGSGKSKLGAWIEEKEPETVHRIGAQRNLNFDSNIPLSNYDDAKNKIIYGTNDEGFLQRHEKGCRWDWGKSTTTKLLDDFDIVLAALIAMYNNEISDFFNNCRLAENAGTSKPATTLTVIDKLMDIWDRIFPQRNLLFEDSKFFAYEKDKPVEKYSANQMSDGERAVLYLVSQVLVVPDNKILIIDEPEIHLHSSIMNVLWEKLEKYREDCLFIYITHDTNFAASHKSSEKIWIKSYDGENWDLERINSDGLPEKLLFDILGSRKNILFVEGEENSFDTQLYSLMYPDYFIIPCGSCMQVIMRTKSFNSTQKIHNYNVYGIIDRDFRTEDEINKLKKYNVYTLNVSEVENLFVIEELIRFLADYLGKDFNEVFNRINSYIIKERFGKQIDSQVNKSIVSQLKHELSVVDISKSHTRESFINTISNINYDRISEETQSLYEEVLKNDDYIKVLEIFNEKGLAKSIGHFLGLNNKDYLVTVISILRNKEQGEILDIFKNYIPDLPD